MKITAQQIELARARLQEMQKAEHEGKNHSKQEAVKILMKEIQQTQEHGYSLEQIAQSLKDGGMEIGTPTLKSYMQRAKLASKVTAAHTQKEEKPHKTARKTQKTTKQPVNLKRTKFTTNEDTIDI